MAIESPQTAQREYLSYQRAIELYRSKISTQVKLDAYEGLGRGSDWQNMQWTNFERESILLFPRQ